jgi:hypothetical protein
MRTFLLPAVLAFGVGLTGIVGASAMVGPGIIDKTTTNLSPSVREVGYSRGCRLVPKCDRHGQNCVQTQVCP